MNCHCHFFPSACRSSCLHQILKVDQLGFIKISIGYSWPRCTMASFYKNIDILSDDCFSSLGKVRSKTTYSLRRILWKHALERPSFCPRSGLFCFPFSLRTSLCVIFDVHSPCLSLLICRNSYRGSHDNPISQKIILDSQVDEESWFMIIKQRSAPDCFQPHIPSHSQTY